MSQYWRQYEHIEGFVKCSLGFERQAPGRWVCREAVPHKQQHTNTTRLVLFVQHKHVVPCLAHRIGHSVPICHAARDMSSLVWQPYQGVIQLGARTSDDAALHQLILYWILLPVVLGLTADQGDARCPILMHPILYPCSGGAWPYRRPRRHETPAAGAAQTYPRSRRRMQGACAGRMETPPPLVTASRNLLH
jgi:hypothetical protein